jgi:hypothetical protein
MEVDPGLLGRWGKFEIVFSRGMENELDKDLRLKLSQGVCGQAVQQKDLCVANLEVPHSPSFGLDHGQRQKTQALTLIFSMPIKRARKMQDGTFALTDDIVGVLNLDSKMKDALVHYNSTVVDGLSLFDRQKRILGEISVVCSYIIS